jgi:hypothetical protein
VNDEHLDQAPADLADKSGDTVSGDTASGETVSGDTVSGDTVSGDTVAGVTVSGDTVAGETVDVDDASPEAATVEAGDFASDVAPAPNGDDGELDDGASGAEASPKPAGPWRRRSFAVARAALVLGGAALLYQVVVPQNHVNRTRLGELVVPAPGPATFNTNPTSGGEQSTTQTGLTALVAAAKKSPNKTALFSEAWIPTSTDAAGIVVALLPSDAQATTTLSQMRGVQLTKDAYAGNELGQQSTFTVAHVPGSAGALYVSTAKPANGAPANPNLGVVLFRVGKVVAAAQVLTTGPAQQDATTAATNEYQLLQKIEPHFTLETVSYPVGPTVAWGIGAVVLALIVALGPWWWRGLQAARRRRRQEEMDRWVVVRGQSIAKHHR